MRRRDQRLIMIAAAGALLVLAMTLVFMGIGNNITYFVSPSELATKAGEGRLVRLGGLVVAGTIAHGEDGATQFEVTDGVTTVLVRTEEPLPDLFREGQGVVAEGRWTPGEPFIAERVLARHDENYMPREVAEALKERGEWKGDAPP